MKNIITEIEKLKDNYYSDYTLRKAGYHEACNDIIKLLGSRTFEIDFGGNVLAKLEVGGIVKIIAAINGYGDSIPLDKITFKELPAITPSTP